jgi:hypothetical protein
MIEVIETTLLGLAYVLGFFGALLVVWLVIEGIARFAKRFPTLTAVALLIFMVLSIGWMVGYLATANYQ